MGRNATDILAKHGIGLTEEELEHAGTKGMKWGRRKKKEAKAEAAAEKEKVKTMSDDELKSRINRIKLEREYAKLTTPEISEGRKIVGRILKEVGEKHAKSYVDAQVGALISSGGKGLLKSAVKAAAKQAAPAPVRQVMQFTPRY